MLDIKFIRENKDLIIKNSQDRLSTVDINTLLRADEKYRHLLGQIEELRAKRNQGSKNKPSQAEIAAMKDVGDLISSLEDEVRVVEGEVHQLLLSVPNLAHADVKRSDNEEDNPVLETVGTIPKLNFAPKDHVELAESLDLVDFERGTKVAGAKFYYLKNELALLSLALNQYVLHIVMKHGYKFMITPDVARNSIIEGLGFNPRGESSQVYQLESQDLGLVGTSEITLGGYHSEEVLALEKLPIKYVGLSHCFRTEAGAYSKFSKGIFRVHQFEKIEMFIYAVPDQAESLHQEMLEIEKEIFSGLGIPFRVVDHCTADLGAPSYRTFDLEAWLLGKPNKEGGAGDWAEITSTSNCTDYQSRSLNIKYVNKEGKKELVYTLNGTANPGVRALIAIMENYQQADGSIKIPEVLIPYMNGVKIIQKTS
ncbi:serine--tRNA ligase [Candidatus Falkowbacteria bacterium]|nr:MAG: serine--tRNA ligase [Candidatus Falkowbacteria bacterium]